MEENETTPEIVQPAKNLKKPFLLRVIALGSVVMGVIGILFFGAVIAYQITDDEFALRFQHTYYNMGAFEIYLWIGLVLHLLLLSAGILTFRLKRIGMWIFLGTAIGFVVFSRVIDENYLWPMILVSFILFIIILAYHKRLN